MRGRGGEERVCADGLYAFSVLPSLYRRLDQIDKDGLRPSVRPS
jgi:hypothetical protein